MSTVDDNDVKYIWEGRSFWNKFSFPDISNKTTLIGVIVFSAASLILFFILLLALFKIFKGLMIHVEIFAKDHRKNIDNRKRRGGRCNRGNGNISISRLKKE